MLDLVILICGFWQQIWLYFVGLCLDVSRSLSFVRSDKTITVLFFQRNQQTHSFPNLFLYKTLQVSGNFSAHHQELATVHWALAYVI